MGLSLEQFRAMASAYQPEEPNTYDGLPDSIKAIVSEKEYAWLSAAEKHRLVQDLTEPDPES